MSPEFLPLPSCCHSLLKMRMLGEGGGAGFLNRSAARSGISCVSGRVGQAGRVLGGE